VSEDVGDVFVVELELDVEVREDAVDELLTTFFTGENGTSEALLIGPCILLRFRAESCKLLRFEGGSCILLRFESELCILLRFEDTSCILLRFEDRSCILLRFVVESLLLVVCLESVVRIGLTTGLTVAGRVAVGLLGVTVLVVTGDLAAVVVLAVLAAVLSTEERTAVLVEVALAGTLGVVDALGVIDFTPAASKDDNLLDPV
jgi:hypothetical protein